MGERSRSKNSVLDGRGKGKGGGDNELTEDVWEATCHASSLRGVGVPTSTIASAGWTLEVLLSSEWHADEDGLEGILEKRA